MNPSPENCSKCPDREDCPFKDGSIGGKLLNMLRDALLPALFDGNKQAEALWAQTPADSKRAASLMMAEASKERCAKFGGQAVCLLAQFAHDDDLPLDTLARCLTELKELRLSKLH